MYLMFGFNYTEGGPWDDNGIKSIAKFADRIERLVVRANELRSNKHSEPTHADKELLYAEAYAVKCVDRDMNNFSFNTAIARLMEYVNALYKYDASENESGFVFKKCVDSLILLLAPCAPHFAEELTDYPVCDENALVKDEVEIAVQVNSKMKAKIDVPTESTDEEAKAIALTDASVAKAVEGKQIVKVIYVKGRLLNLIVK